MSAIIIIVSIISILTAVTIFFNPYMTLAQNESIITIGGVEVKPTGPIEPNATAASQFFMPIIDYVAPKLADGQTANTTGNMINLLRDQNIDFYIDSSLVSAYMNNKSGAVPFLRGWAEGEPEYNSLIVVKRESPINNLDDLVGKSISFKVPSSTSGYLLPKAYLIQKGFNVVNTSTPNDNAINNNTIYYGF